MADALITSLADPEIKQGMLGEPDQPLSLERAMLHVESKKTSVSLLDPGTSMGAVRQSGYKKTPRARRMQPNTETDNEKCYFCVKTGHGKYPPISLRSAECHTFGHTCGKCGKLNHAGRVCRSKQPSTENARVATSQPTGRDNVAHSITMCSTQPTTDGLRGSLSPSQPGISWSN